MRLDGAARDHFARHPLTSDDTRSLRSIQHGRGIPPGRARALIDHGYARVGLGGLMLTDIGRMRLLVPHG